MTETAIATVALVATTILLTVLCVRHARRHWYRNHNN